MLIGIGASIYSGNRYDAAISSASLAARFDAALGITSSGGFASAWADLSGNGRSLLQATGANQPIHLAFAGTKYGWLPGVGGNYFSTTDSVAASITGDIALVKKLFATDYSHSANQVLIAKDDNGTEQSYLFYLDTSGIPQFRWSVTGGAGISRSATSAVYANGLSNNNAGYIAVTLDVDNGTGYEVKFFTSLDGATWTQLGATVATVAAATSIYNSSTAVTVGGWAASALGLIGGAYSAQIYNGIPPIFGGSGSENPVVDFDPSRWTSGSTFTAATGETWTINSTGSKPAQIVDRSSLLFDGAAHYMKCAAFTLNQPETIYWVGKQISWTAGDYILDGNTGNSGAFAQQSASVSPNLQLYAGASGVTGVANLAVGSKGVACCVFNGANSSLQINAHTPVVGNAGAANMGGFTFGASGAAAAHANIQAHEVLIYNTAHDASTRAAIIRALMAKWGIA